MSDNANTFNSLKPIYKEGYSDVSKKKKSKGKFSRIRAKILKDWKPKKVGM